MVDMWDEAARWIESNGGYVHPSLRFSSSDRQVHLGDNENDDDDGCTLSFTTTTTTTTTATDFDAGITLLRIPDSCLLTLHSVEADETFGKLLFAVVDSLQQQQQNNAGSGDDDGNDNELYNDSQDVVLALWLGYLRQQLDEHNKQQAGGGGDGDGDISNKNDDTNKNMSCDDSSKPWLFYQPYLATLPSSSECNLPHQWSTSTIKYRLQGTSLYNRMLKEKAGIEKEYNAVKSAWMDNRSNNNNVLFPSFQYYDTMMALLTSRGFAGLGDDSVDAMIPLLDLLNHVRGSPQVDASNGNGNASGEDHNGQACQPTKSSTDTSNNNNNNNNRRGPDVRYERYEDDDRKAQSGDKILPSSKRQRITFGGGVRVSTAHTLPKKSVLHMTYGAKSNHSLLGRFGFCIPNNIEPDGSCNDILEIKIKPNYPPVKLQIGPKSYSYAPFATAVGVCRLAVTTETAEENTGDIEKEEEGGLDAFLDECDNELNNSNDDYDEDEDSKEESIDNNINSKATAANESMKKDLIAIDALKDVLQHIRSGLVDNPLMRDQKRRTEDGGSRDCIAEEFCLHLIHSEVNTLDFYMAVATSVGMKLSQLESKNKTATTNNKHCLSNEIWNESVIQDIVDTFVMIRYPK